MPIERFAAHLNSYMGTPQRYGLEAAAQTYGRGAPLVINAAGHLEEAGTDPVGIQGFAAQPGANNATAGAATAFYDPLYDDEYIGSVDTSAAEGTGTSAQTQVGERFGITRSAQAGQVGRWYVDTNKTDIADQRVEIVRLIDAAATIQGRVAFKWIAT